MTTSPCEAEDVVGTSHSLARPIINKVPPLSQKQGNCYRQWKNQGLPVVSDGQERPCPSLWRAPKLTPSPDHQQQAGKEGAFADWFFVYQSHLPDIMERVDMPSFAACFFDNNHLFHAFYFSDHLLHVG